LTTSGHRLDLVNGKLFTVDDKLVNDVSNLIGEKLLDLERKETGAFKNELRMLIFSYSRHLLQMQGYVTDKGKRLVYVAGSPIDGNTSTLSDQERRELPKTLVLPDGGGIYHWQAYVDIDKKEVDISFNNDF